MADKLSLTNDTVGYAYEEQVFTRVIEGAYTADDVTANIVTVVPFGKSGRIVGAYLVHGENGADGTDAMSNALDVKINTTSIFSTLPALAKAAGTGKRTTFAAATGVTVGVINTAADDVVAGDIVFAEFDITRTTPETEYANVCAVVVVRWATV